MSGAFTPEQLRAVRRCIVHDNCSDGMAAAVLLRDALPPDVEISFVQYNTHEHDHLEAVPGLLFCDFSPPPTRVEEFRAVGALVLDHHRSAQSLVQVMGAGGVFADEPGVSGATLAYRHVWQPIHGGINLILDRAAEQLARLIGVRDTWQTQSADWAAARQLHEVLRFYDWDYWQQPFYRHDWSALQRLGAHLVQRHERHVQQTQAGALRYASTRGTSVLIVQGVSAVISDLAESVGSAYDVVVGFSYFVKADQPQIVFSCRAHGDFDVGALCTHHGGGGHTHSAAFSKPVQVVDNDLTYGDADPNPYGMFLALLDSYETSSSR
jgi:hypothetical protein